MATASVFPKVRFEYGVPETLALKYVAPKAVDGGWGPQFMWTCTDERKMYLDAEDGADVDRRLTELGVRPGQMIEITKVRHPRGGGHSFRVELAGELAEETPLAAKLSQSLAAVRSGERPRAPEAIADEARRTAAPEPAMNPASVKMLAAFAVAIDALAEAQAYAERKSLRVAFSAEDVRCVALSVYISGERR